MKVNRASVYASQALAHTGFAVLNGQIAAELRPDLWHTGVEASGDVADERTRIRLEDLRRVMPVKAQLDGFSVPVDVLTRSLSHLAERIELVTGRKAVLVDPDAKPTESTWAASRRKLIASQAHAADVATAVLAPGPAPVRVEQPTGDRWESVASKDGLCTCSQCARISVSGNCPLADESGLPKSPPRESRRCTAFKAIRAIYRAERAKGPTDVAWTTLWRELQEVGGTTGYRDLLAYASDRMKAVDTVMIKDRAARVRELQQQRRAVATRADDGYRDLRQLGTRIADVMAKFNAEVPRATRAPAVSD